MANGRYQPSYGNPAGMLQQGEVFHSRPVRDPVQTAKDLVFKYNRNPKAYTDEQAEKIAFIAARLGIPFKAESKALQKFFFDAIDNLTFGALPDDARPVSRGETVFGPTRSEKIAEKASLLGYLGPGVAGAKIGGKLAKKVVGGLPSKFGGGKLRQAIDQSFGPGYAGGAGPGALSRGVQGAGMGAGAFALTDILEDPAGAAGRALQGAAVGGALGALIPSMGAMRFHGYDHTKTKGFPQLGTGARQATRPAPAGTPQVGTGTPFPQLGAASSTANRSAGLGPVRSGGRQARFDPDTRGLISQPRTQYIFPDGRTALIDSRVSAQSMGVGTRFRVGQVTKGADEIQQVFLEYAPKFRPGFTEAPFRQGSEQLDLFSILQR